MSNSYVGHVSIPANLIAIDGITRSGKFWLAELMTYFDRMETILHEPVLDFISIKSYFGELESQSAIDLIRNIVSQKCFNTSIGRYVNFRLGDSSSIYRHPRSSVFLSRVHQIKSQEFENLKTVNLDEVVFPILAHDWMSVWGIQPQALPSMKIIRVERNPIDLVFAWFSTGIGLKEMSFNHRFIAGEKSIPWFASEFSQDFENQSEIDRIINSVLYLFESSRPVINKLLGLKNGRFLLTSYERMGENLGGEITRISSFIGLSTIPEMKGFVEMQKQKERSKKSLLEARTKKINVLKSMATKECFAKLVCANDRYHDLLND
jgi:hypothetical protein